ncbi:unnamed protein product [Phytophthora fragariaefolia]|uniref:Unnamed protein product n=1 Tax=Phytophthora fragariaefolia TaxID=1490495 RepID=A0A9W6YD15_9STRA|nr:unnamed protein product [Phytophthora fragariaefolia]
MPSVPFRFPLGGRTDSGGEYQNVDLFDKDTGVARQRSEANNQASNGKAEHMHRTVMNMARCMVFVCGLPLSFWGDAVPYAAYILSRAPTNVNPGRASPLKVMTKQTPQLGKIVVFRSLGTVYRDPSNKNFSQRAQQGMIVGIGEEVKGYREYLPKDKKVVTSQHVRNIETLSKTQNLQVQRLYRDEDEADSEKKSGEQGSGAADQSSTGEESDTKGRRKGRRKGTNRKRPWRRERHVTRSVARAAEAETAEAEQRNMAAENVVNNAMERDSRNYNEAMLSRHKAAWLKAIAEELRALVGNGVWEVVRVPKDVRVLHPKWAFKTKLDAEGLIERHKARLVACGNKQSFGVDYSVTFAAVIDMTSSKLILALARKWRVPAKHGDVLNAYVKADKEEDLRIYVRVPQGMKIPEEILKELGVDTDAEVALQLKKALYGLKQAGRLWSKLLHSKLLEIGFDLSLVDMCVYHRYNAGVLIVVGVYVDDLLVTGTQQHAVDVFFEELKSLEIQDLGCAHKFLGMRIGYSDEYGCDLDQEVTIDELLQAYGLEKAPAVGVPIGEDWNEAQDASTELLPVGGAAGAATVATFQSLVGSWLWVARCTRPDITFVVHKATRRTHAPTVADWKLAKRVLRYLAGTRSLKLRMKGYGGVDLPLDVVGYSDADYAGDKADRKSTTGGLITVDGMVVSWICRKQGGVSLSTMEAEYTATSVVAQELLGVRELLGEMKVPQKVSMKLCVDNQAALKQLEGEQSSVKAKHIDVRIKFVVDYVRRGVLRAESVGKGSASSTDLLGSPTNSDRSTGVRAGYSYRSLVSLSILLAKYNNLSRAAAYRLCKAGDPSPPARGGVRAGVVKRTDNIIEAMEAYLEEECTLTLSQLADKVLETFGVHSAPTQSQKLRFHGRQCSTKLLQHRKTPSNYTFVRPTSYQRAIKSESRKIHTANF